MITKEQILKSIKLMRQDVAAFEQKYQGKFAEKPHIGLGNRKTRCVNEATLPIITCEEEGVARRDALIRRWTSGAGIWYDYQPPLPYELRLELPKGNLRCL